MFDEKCKCCKNEMTNVQENLPNSCNGIFITYHCPNCGTYAYYYDNDKEPQEWIIPKLASLKYNIS